jgi:hypothetical protein
MKRSLAKPARRRKAAARKAVSTRPSASKKNDYDTRELLITAAAVLTFFFSVLASMALNSELRYAAAVGNNADTIENRVNEMQTRLQNEQTLNGMDSLKRQNTTNN